MLNADKLTGDDDQLENKQIIHSISLSAFNIRYLRNWQRYN